MRIGLFIPCYVDQLRPAVGIATVRLLEAFGLPFEFPEDQTCCGQPFLTAGERAQACRFAARFVDVFADYDRVVTPSGSCAAMIRSHLAELVSDRRARALAGRTRELCELLVECDADRGRVGRFPHRVGLHASCHALRSLRHGQPSESRAGASAGGGGGEGGGEGPAGGAPAADDGRAPLDPARRLLAAQAGIELVALARRDDGCGVGGIFCVEEEAVSCRMGHDRLADHERAGAAIVTSTDVSCLLQLEGLARRRGSPLVFRHVAEILAEGWLGPDEGADGPSPSCGPASPADGPPPIGSPPAGAPDGPR
ncbi:MAG: (Fe-S)-binding protein [Myxococcota bacterium]